MNSLIFDRQLISDRCESCYLTRELNSSSPTNDESCSSHKLNNIDDHSPERITTHLRQTVRVIQQSSFNSRVELIISDRQLMMFNDHQSTRELNSLMSLFTSRITLCEENNNSSPTTMRVDHQRVDHLARR